MSRLSVYLFSCLGLSAILFGCGGTPLPENPLNRIKEKHKSKKIYSILLEDMDLRNDTYYHRYKICEVDKDEIKFEKTDWIKVDEDFFLLHEDDLGMEIFSKIKSGIVNNLVSPQGFSNIIGQETFGRWRHKNELAQDSMGYIEDSALWVFYPQYIDAEKELGLFGLPIWYVDYSDFMTNSFFVKPYYGEREGTDSTYYGTRSSYWYWHRPWFYSRRESKGGFHRTNSSSNSGGSSRGGGGFGK